MACGGVRHQCVQHRIGLGVLRGDGLRQVREPRQGYSARHGHLSVRSPCGFICPCSCHRAVPALVVVVVVVCVCPLALDGLGRRMQDVENRVRALLLRAPDPIATARTCIVARATTHRRGRIARRSGRRPAVGFLGTLVVAGWVLLVSSILVPIIRI